MREKNTQNKKRERKKTPCLDYVKLAGFISSICAVAACASYLFFINDLSVKGFQLKEMAKKSKELADEKNKLELDALKLGSLAQVESKVGKLGMVKVDKTEFIVEKDKSVAVR